MEKKDVEEIIKNLEKNRRELTLLREDLNKLEKYHLAGELSAVCIVLEGLEQVLFENPDVDDGYMEKK
ncbi:unnamed protein product [marine sediment metagenome]|uniref:Uncharacterized protein n=1 Tax=marine sediment metagenome TaxID=412755 RepID=X1EM11_9ZZZZ